ncbi:MAG: YCF48-related protein [Ignavibacteriaceae bacterium]|nr:YCF48-related protein [Ignavibacteriaceae bacterium]
MRTLKISLLIFIIPITLFAQWHWQNPTPFGNGLSDIQFLTTSVGYACGSGGNLIKTTNGGKTWFEIESGTDDLIIDIFFLSEDIGWFLSYSDREVYKTTDGGSSWEIISNLSPRYAYSLWFINEMKGFAVGYQYLLSTTDGGVTWNEVNNVYSTSSIYFYTSNVGFVGGLNSIYSTSNGGNTWINLPLPTFEFTPSAIFAHDQYNIYVVGTGDFQGEPYYAFLKSTNSGYTWSGANFNYWLIDVYFTSLSDGWVCSDKIYKTTDGGSNWTATEFEGSHFQFIENQTWAISGRNTIIYSNDFWLTADQQIKSVFSGFLWNGAAKDTNVVFACGSNKTIVGSFDGGLTWDKYFESTEQTYLNSITFKGNEIWAVGAGGVILNSINNGISWDENYVNATWLSDIKFINDDLGFIVGSISGLACIYSTKNGGDSWELQQTFNEYSGIEGIEFASENLGWMIAYSNGLLKSADLGQTWNVVVDSIYFFGNIATSGDSAWFSYGRNVLRTTNAGLSWESFRVFNYEGINFGAGRIDFVNSKVGYLSTGDGRVFKTQDGGETWIEEECPSVMPIQAIDFVDVKRGWTFGDCGTILKRDPNYVYVGSEEQDSPKEFILSQNYPNPFNPVTKIRYEIPGQARNDIDLVTLKVYDILGREVATLVNEEKPAGQYEVEFNSPNLPSGIYFYQLKVGLFVETKKMVLIK